MPEAAAPPFLVASGVTKSFGGAQALRGVGLTLGAGEVHGLVGANGAGKSTFIRILAGLVQPDAGSLRVDGAETGPLTPQAATALGLSFIHQELALVPSMTVIENIMLGMPKATRLGLVDWKAVEATVRPVAERVGIHAPLHAEVRRLPTSEQWLVSICRALVRRARLIVMDEPTAALSEAEAERLFAIVRDLSASGVATLYVSHRLDEITRLCDGVTVFRDGALAAEFPKDAISRTALVQAIVGGELARQAEPVRGQGKGPVVLALDGLARAPAVRGVSLGLRAGEVLGLGGLVGSGRSELAQLVFGADRPDAGRMTLEGRAFAPASPAAAVRAGVGYVPEERRADGLLLTKSIAFNLSLANLRQVAFAPALPLVSPRRQRGLAEETIRALAIKAEGPAQAVGRLSGGNQQKVVIGRWLARRPKVMILDEPTRGVDVGARAEIHRLVRRLAAEGMAVLAISSEPEELPDLCDRVLVMAEGRIVKELDGAEVTRRNIVAASYAGEEEPVT
jgi:ribose transport system ATP-binding protein/rhamnose transport system ATP-binding protein